MCHPAWSDEVVQGVRADVDVGDRQMPAWRYEPTARAERPVLLLSDIYGPLPFYRHLAGELAQLGHPTLLVDLFVRQWQLERPEREFAFERLAALDAARSLEDADAAAAVLAADGGRVGLLGFCLGGQLALDLAARRSDLVTLTYYAFPEDLPQPVATSAPRPIDLAEEITGPIMGFWGDEDYIPVDVIERFGQAMADHGVAYEGHVLSGAGHGFLQGIVEDRPDSEVAVAAWTQGTTFLTQHLGA